MTILRTYEEIDRWFSDNGHFEDGHILHVETNPMSLTVGYTTKGNYNAYSEHHIQPFKIIPSGILEIGSLDLLDGNYFCVESIEPLETDKGVGIRITASRFFDIVAESFTIQTEKLIKTTFQPWVNPDEISAFFPSHAIPTPAFWKEKFKEKGYNIVFRYYGGEEIKPEELPYPNYHGFFIQSPELIKGTLMGLFIRFVDINNGVVSLALEKRDEEIKDKEKLEKMAELWKELVQIVFGFSHVTIKSGNCEFAGNEWNDFLLGRSRPPKKPFWKFFCK